MNKILEESLKRVVMTAFLTTLVTQLATRLVDKLLPSPESEKEDE